MIFAEENPHTYVTIPMGLPTYIARVAIVTSYETPSRRDSPQISNI